VELETSERAEAGSPAQESHVQYGQRIRIETCDPVCEWRHQGPLVRWAADSVAIATNDGVVTLPRSTIGAVDADVHQSFDGTGALWGGVIGAVAFAAVTQASGAGVGGRVAGQEHSLAMPAGAIGAGLGVLFGGGGRSARRGAGIGLAIGAGVGAIGGVIWCQLAEGFLSCAPEGGAAYGALAVGGIGTAIGVIVGALDRDRWQRISVDRVSVTPVATPDGRIGLAAHLRF